MQDDTTTDNTIDEGAEESTTPDTIVASAESFRSDEQLVADNTDEAEDDSTTSTDDTEEDSEESELLAWAEKAGLDTKDPVKILKSLKDTQKKLHESTSKASELRKQVSESEDFTDGESVIQEARVLNFYAANPEARSYDMKMGEIYNRFQKSDPEFATHLVKHLDTLYAMAKAEDNQADVLKARQQGKEEAIKKTKQAQASSAPRANAVSSAPQSTGLTAEKVREIVASGKYNEYRDEILAWERSQYGL
jgi:hypothetical protein